MTYRPANATEGDAFERRWCAHCVHYDLVPREDELGDYIAGCDILANVQAGAVSSYWTVKDGMPWCLAYQEDKDNPARCLFTKEMF